MRTVYIINKSSHDFEPAKKFGKLEYLSYGRWYRYDQNKIFREFLHRLRESNPDDLILLTGLPTMQAIACSIMVYLHGRLNTLSFKQRKGEKFYIERNLVFPDKKEEKNDA